MDGAATSTLNPASPSCGPSELFVIGGDISNNRYRFERALPAGKSAVC